MRQATHEFETLRVHTGNDRAAILALEFDDFRSRKTQHEMRRQLARGRDPPPGREQFEVEVSQVAAGINEKEHQA